MKFKKMLMIFSLADYKPKFIMCHQHWSIWEMLRNIKMRQLVLQSPLEIFMIGLFIAYVIVSKLFVYTYPYDVLPCHYLHSINISDGIQQNDGSIEFDNITYPTNKYAEMDAVLSFDEKKEPYFKTVEPYKRGCICEITKLKCMHYVIPNDTERKEDGLSHQTLQNELKEQFGKDYVYINEKPCTYVYPAKEDDLKDVNMVYFQLIVKIT